MNVLFLTAWYPTAENQGYGVFIKEHAKAIQSASNELVVLAVLSLYSKSFFEIRVNDFQDESGIRTVEILIHSRFRDAIYHLIPFQNRIAFHYYKKLISKDFVPEIIHSNVIFPAGTTGRYFQKKLHLPHVITEHWSKIESALSKFYLSRSIQKSFQEADAVLPVSNYLKSNILKLLPGLQSQKFHVVPNVIDSETYFYKPKLHSNETVKFCAVATWATKKIPDKMPELFMEALNIVQKSIHQKIVLTMVGSGDRVKELRKMQLNYPVEFVGYRSKSEIADILHQSDFMLHASAMETFGIVVAEALMTGTPVVCSNVGALPELVDETNGILCENTLNDWVLGIEKALNAEFNHKKISEAVAHKFSYHSIGEQINEVYQQIVDQPKSF